MLPHLAIAKLAQGTIHALWSRSRPITGQGIVIDGGRRPPVVISGAA
jgi:hypothetical protein